jgi:adenylylsulfate kinase
VAVFAAFVSPYRDVRREMRKIVEEEVPFFEVYVKVSLEEAMRRDPKGLYKRALAGEVKNFTGVDDPYEEPEAPDLVLVNEGVSVEVNVERLLEFLASRGVYDRGGRLACWRGLVICEVSMRLEAHVGARRGAY